LSQKNNNPPPAILLLDRVASNVTVPYVNVQQPTKFLQLSTKLCITSTVSAVQNHCPDTIQYILMNQMQPANNGVNQWMQVVLVASAIAAENYEITVISVSAGEASHEL